ncbi:MAG: tetratricopeptide repeat protein [Chthoniobacterales bacterium]
MPTASPVKTDAAIETRVFWLRYRNEVIAVLIVALLAALGYGSFRIYTERRDAAGGELLAAGKTVSDYQQVIARYPNTAASADAYLLLADAQRREGKFAEANLTLQSFLTKYPKSELAPTARLAMAGNLDVMGKTDEALAIYQQIASAYPKSYAAPLALISRAQLLKTKNRSDEARQVCEAIMTQYRDSFWAREAMQLLMSVKSNAPPTPPGKAGPTNAGQQPPALLARPPESRPFPPPSPGAKKPR